MKGRRDGLRGRRRTRDVTPRPLFVGLQVFLVIAAAAALSGCASRAADEPATGIEVPDLVGKEYRPTQMLLAELGLRWRFVGTERVWSKPPPENMWSTADDDLVREQSPTAGTKVAPNSVIELRTSCTMKPLPPDMVCID